MTEAGARVFASGEPIATRASLFEILRQSKKSERFFGRAGIYRRSRSRQLRHFASTGGAVAGRSCRCWCLLSVRVRALQHHVVATTRLASATRNDSPSDTQAEQSHQGTKGHSGKSGWSAKDHKNQPWKKPDYLRQAAKRGSAHQPCWRERLISSLGRRLRAQRSSTFLPGHLKSGSKAIVSAGRSTCQVPSTTFPKKREFYWRGVCMAPILPNSVLGFFSDGGAGDGPPWRYRDGTNIGGKSSKSPLSRASSAACTWGKSIRGFGLRSLVAFLARAHTTPLLIKSQTALKSGPTFRTFFWKAPLLPKTSQKPLIFSPCTYPPVPGYVK